jgi:DNA-binding NtrC family response regulator
VVEDDALVRQLLREMLRSNGYSVETAMDAEEAELLLRDGAFELAVVDVLLPAEDGLSLWQRSRTVYPDLRALLISGHAPSDALQAELGEGRASFLPKPFRAESLLLAVEAALPA